MDVQQLGLEVKSQGIAKASADLDKLSGSARKAEQAANGVTGSSSNASDRLRKLGQATAAIDGPLGGVASRFRSLGTLINETSIATVGFMLALGGAFLAVRRFLGEFRDRTVENDKVQVQLASAVKSTGGAAQRSVAQLNAHAAALQKITNYGDEVTNVAQGLLLTFTNIRGDQYDAATVAVLDLATAMRMDLKSAALQVGKALNDPVLGVTALQRSGIQFSESQKDLIKDLVESGKMVEAQTIILKELETQFGGSAEAARSTLGGALDSLSNAWGDLFELPRSATESLRRAIESLIVAIQNPAFAAFVQMIGRLLFGAMELAVRGVTLLANTISFLSDNADILAIALGGLSVPLLASFGPTIIAAIVTGVVTLTRAIGYGLVTAVRALTAAMLANPLVLFVSAVAAAATALYRFRDYAGLGQAALRILGVAADEVKDKILTLSDVFYGFMEALKVHQNQDAFTAIAAARLELQKTLETMEEARRNAEMRGIDTSHHDRALAHIRAEIEAVTQEYDALNQKREIDEMSFTERVAHFARERARIRAEEAAAAAESSEAISNAAPIAAMGEGEFEKSIAQMRERTRGLQSEANVVGMATYQAEKYLAIQQLIQAAQKDGLSLDDSRLRMIESESAAYAEMAARLEDVQDAQRRTDDLRDTFRGAFSTFAQDVRRGESAIESLGAALDRLAEKLMDMAANNLFDAAFGRSGTSSPLFSAVSGAGGGGLLGGILIPGILHKGGIAGSDNYPKRAVAASLFDGAPRYHNGGVAGLKPNEVPAILERGERVLPKSQSSVGSDANVTIIQNNDFRGVNAADRAWFESRLEQSKRQAVSESVAAVAKTRSLNPRYGQGVF